jgi:hypothetical protein
VLLWPAPVSLSLSPTRRRPLPTTLEFDASLSSVDAALNGTFQVGDPVSTWLVYDAATPDVLPADPNLAVYDFISFDLTLGGCTASFASHAAGGVGIVVLNNVDQITETVSHHGSKS